MSAGGFAGDAFLTRRFRPHYAGIGETTFGIDLAVEVVADTGFAVAAVGFGLGIEGCSQGSAVGERVLAHFGIDKGLFLRRHLGVKALADGISQQIGGLGLTHQGGDAVAGGGRQFDLGFRQPQRLQFGGGLSAEIELQRLVLGPHGHQGQFALGLGQLHGGGSAGIFRLEIDQFFAVTLQGVGLFVGGIGGRNRC